MVRYCQWISFLTRTATGLRCLSRLLCGDLVRYWAHYVNQRRYKLLYMLLRRLSKRNSPRLCHWISCHTARLYSIQSREIITSLSTSWNTPRTPTMKRPSSCLSLQTWMAKQLFTYRSSQRLETHAQLSTSYRSSCLRCPLTIMVGLLQTAFHRLWSLSSHTSLNTSTRGLSKRSN